MGPHSLCYESADRSATSMYVKYNERDRPARKRGDKLLFLHIRKKAGGFAVPMCVHIILTHLPHLHLSSSAFFSHPQPSSIFLHHLPHLSVSLYLASYPSILRNSSISLSLPISRALLLHLAQSSSICSITAAEPPVTKLQPNHRPQNNLMNLSHFKKSHWQATCNNARSEKASRL